MKLLENKKMQLTTGVLVEITAMITIVCLSVLTTLTLLNITLVLLNALFEFEESARLIDWKILLEIMLITTASCLLTISSYYINKVFEKRAQFIKLKARRIRKQQERIRYREIMKKEKLEQRKKSVWWNC